MKSEFRVERISKQACAAIISQFHYLKDLSRGFQARVCFGCFKGVELCGVISFSQLSCPELAQGLCGRQRNEQDDILELSRLCLVPSAQQSEHNLAGWFVARALRLLRTELPVKAVIAYADATYHQGTVYKACGFSYYGLTDQKSDFWDRRPDGSFRKHRRGPVSGTDGEWRPRTRKHRYLMAFDPTLTIKWEAPDDSSSG